LAAVVRGNRSIELFEAVAPPAHHGTGAREIGRWFTWSREAIDLIEQLRQSWTTIPEPQLVHVGESDDEYNYTYSLGADAELSELRPMLLPAAYALQRHLGSAGFSFFSGLIRSSISRGTVHVFLALLRDAFVAATADPWSSLYAPLSETGESAGGFPLHADLYPSAGLWAIFDDVPDDGSGGNIFLSADQFAETLTSTAELPESVRTQILQTLAEDRTYDGWHDFYTSLYGAGIGLIRQSHPWSDSLAREMEKRTTEVPLKRGEGYLLHDRHWLHGRRRPTTGVSENRMLRLVFPVAI
jgi:hypothetical protein